GGRRADGLHWTRLDRALRSVPSDGGRSFTLHFFRCSARGGTARPIKHLKRRGPATMRYLVTGLTSANAISRRQADRGEVILRATNQYGFCPHTVTRWP